MADYIWPSDIVPFNVEFYLQPHTGGTESPFSRQTKTYGLSAPRWVCRMSIRGGYNSEWRGKSGDWGQRLDAILATLKGRQNRVALPDFRRTRSTFGQINAPIAAGDTRVILTKGTLQIGDYIGGDGRPHIVRGVGAIGDRTVLTVEPPFSAAVHVGRAIYDYPPGWFKLSSDDAGANMTEVGQLTVYNLEFVEDLGPAQFSDVGAGLSLGTMPFWERLLHLAQVDGWHALYDPGNPTTRSTRVNDVDDVFVLSIADALGNLPEATEPDGEDQLQLIDGYFGGPSGLYRRIGAPPGGLRTTTFETLTGPFFMMALAQYDRNIPATTNRYLWDGANPFSPSLRASLYVDAVNGFSSYSAMANSTELVATGPQVDRRSHVVSALYNGASSKIYLDGTQIAAGAMGEPSRLSALLIANAWDYPTGAQWVGAIGPLLIYNGTPPEDVRMRMETFLAAETNKTNTINAMWIGGGD